MNKLIALGFLVLLRIGTIKMFKKIWESDLITQDNGKVAEVRTIGVTQKEETELNLFGIIKNFILSIVCLNFQVLMIQLYLQLELKNG